MLPSAPNSPTHLLIVSGWAGGDTRSVKNLSSLFSLSLSASLPDPFPPAGSFSCFPGLQGPKIASPDVSSLFYDFPSGQFIVHFSIIFFVSAYAGTRNEGGSVATCSQFVIPRWYVYPVFDLFTSRVAMQGGLNLIFLDQMQTLGAPSTLCRTRWLAQSD